MPFGALAVVDVPFVFIPSNLKYLQIEPKQKVAADDD